MYSSTTGGLISRKIFREPERAKLVLVCRYARRPIPSKRFFETARSCGRGWGSRDWGIGDVRCQVPPFTVLDLVARLSAVFSHEGTKGTKTMTSLTVRVPLAAVSVFAQPRVALTG